MQDWNWRLLADTVLVLHLAVVLFVVLGFLYVLLGNWRHWPGANALWFRVLHLVAIGIVVIEAWIGATCPLTSFEHWLRIQAGEVGYAHGFIQHWVQRLLFHDAPLWVFTLAYTLFGLAVVAAWWRWPPRGAARAPDSRKPASTETRR
jgi:polyferredoxin